jgi:uncharacterized lipoprotein YmbA
MKSGFFVTRILVIAVIGLLFTGCLLRRATVSTRDFMLAPILTNEPTAVATGHLSIGIGLVKMPPYLLRDSVAVRNGANEIEYFEDAVWAERLDQGFQRTLAANLSRLLSSDSIYVADWRSDQVMARVFIDIEQFDVDISGRGTLIARWRILAPDSDRLLKGGQIRLAQTGTSPRGHPAVVAAMLSDLAAEFSRELAQSIRDSVPPKL